MSILTLFDLSGGSSTPIDEISVPRGIPVDTPSSGDPHACPISRVTRRGRKRRNDGVPTSSEHLEVPQSDRALSTCPGVAAPSSGMFHFYGILGFGIFVCFMDHIWFYLFLFRPCSARFGFYRFGSHWGQGGH